MDSLKLCRFAHPQLSSMEDAQNRPGSEDLPEVVPLLMEALQEKERERRLLEESLKMANEEVRTEDTTMIRLY